MHKRLFACAVGTAIWIALFVKMFLYIITMSISDINTKADLENFFKYHGHNYTLKKEVINDKFGKPYYAKNKKKHWR